MTTQTSRRDILKFVAASAVTTLALSAAEPDAPLYFNKAEFALLDKLTDLFIPTDEHSPGAHAAGVAAYIDRMVAEAITADEKLSWKNGLHSIDELSQSRSGNAFLKSSKEEQIALLTKIAGAERNPQTAPEKFFTQLKQTTAFVYYTSKIGIHQEINYKGNVLLQEFVGYDAT